jgi:DNA invertase Pin-like site-specific DNA recombinase
MDEGPRRAVAQYLRMSTDMQTYSLELQAAANSAFADARGWRIVRTYIDPGVSGLSFNARPGLRALLADVLAGAPDYDAVLVYDVSRWGRFQDLDQGAHYEFVCREAGVEVIYSAEPFGQDGSLASAILKHLKRVMAAEYSRDLSAKVRRAQRGLQAEGYWVGGSPGYGLRRLSVSPTGETGALMQQGQRKALHGYRVVLVTGPEDEVRTVRRIYSLFLVAGLRMPAIAGLLNAEGISAERGAAWTRQRVRSVLTNEKYSGVLVGGRHTGPLGGVRRLRPRSEWVRAENGLAPLIPRARFDLVQAQLRAPRSVRPSDAQLLEELRAAWRDVGRLSTGVIDDHPLTHAAVIYKRRFGSLEAAYARVGYQPSLRQQTASRNARARDNGRFKPRPDPIDPDIAWAALEAHYARLGRVSSNTIEADPDLPSVGWYRNTFGSMETIYARLGHQPSARQRFHIDLQRQGVRNYRRPS